MPDTFTWDEVQEPAKPQKFSFEEVQAPDIEPFGGRGVTSAPAMEKPYKESNLPAEPGVFSKAANAIESGVEHGLTGVANKGIDAYNILKRGSPNMQAMAGNTKDVAPLTPGQSLLPENAWRAVQKAVPQSLDAVTRSGKSDDLAVDRIMRQYDLAGQPRPSVEDVKASLSNSPAAEGVTAAGVKAAKGFTTLSGLATLPLFEYPLVRAAFAASGIASTPEAVNTLSKTLSDPKASAAQKWEAGGDFLNHVAVTAAMTLSLGAHEPVTAEQVKSKYTPEEAAQIAQPKTSEPTPAAEPATQPAPAEPSQPAVAPAVPTPPVASAVEPPKPTAEKLMKAESDSALTPPEKVQDYFAEEVPQEPVKEEKPAEEIVDRSVNKAETPAAKGGRPRTQYPPNPILDYVNDEAGSIRLKSNGNSPEQYEGDSYSVVQKSGHVKFSPTGIFPNQIVKGLVDAGLVKEGYTADDLWQDLHGAVNERKQYSKGETPEQKQEKFHNLVGQGEKSNRTYPVSVGEMNVGQKFKIKGVEFEVAHIDKKTGEVTVKDGKKFGSQTIPDGADVPVDKGSLKGQPRPLQNPDWSVEGVPKQKPPTVPKLRPGEKAGDLLQGEDAPFNLAGETGTDAERIAAAKAKAEQTRKEAAEIEKKQQSEMIGMGGAIPSEFDQSAKTATGIKNATVDAERAQRGLPPAMKPMKRDFDNVWTQAMNLVDRDPSFQDRLIDQLRQKPRALTDLEDALILHRQLDLQNEYGKATRDMAQAFDDGREDAVQQEELRIAHLSDQLQDIYDIGKKSGTETGRGLNARKMMAYEDFTLAKMELEKRAANQGRPLTSEERSQMTDLQKRIQETQEAFDKYKTEQEAKAAQRRTQDELDRIKREADKQPPFNPKVLEYAKKFVDSLDKRADAARIRLRERLGRTSAGVDPTVLVDLAEIGAAKLAHKALDFADWTNAMLEDLGEYAAKFRPHMEEIYAASQKKLDELLKKVDEPTKQRVKSNATNEQKVAGVKEAIVEKVKAGKKNELAYFVQRLARLLVESGVKDREALIDQVHGILKESIPDISRRETMDAISGYGDFKQLSKDQISIQLRGMKGEMQQIAKLEDMAKGEPPKKSGVERRTPTEAERQLVKRVNEAKFKFQVPMDDPATQLKSALDTFKTTMRNRITDLEDKIKRGDYSKTPRRELKLDNEALRLKADNERLKQQWRQGLNRDRLKQRTSWEKVQDAVVKWRRGFILSGPVTLAKLTTAAIARGVITPLEEAAGHAIGSVIPSVSAKAPREGGGLSTRAEVKAITEGITKGMKDAWDVLRTGKSNLDAVYKKDPGLPQSFIDIFGNIHGALKAPVKRAEFARSFEKRANFYARQGVDITDEFVQTRIGLEAFQDAERSIFMQKNIINDAYKRALSRFDQPSKVTGKPSMAGKALGTAARTLLPIVKVPTNIVAETMQYALGSVTGSVRLAKAFHDGISKLSPEDADLIMRHLKKGSLGAAVMLAGFLNPDMLGGFYQQGEKRKKEDIKPDAARIGGVNIPSYAIHNPFTTAAQIGATVRRVSDSKLRKHDKNTQGLSHGAIAGAFGLAEATPFVREMLETAKAFSPYERDQWAGNLAKSMAVPQGVQSLANWLDKDKEGETVKRKPENPIQAIESGIPGLRQNVPAKK